MHRSKTRKDTDSARYKELHRLDSQSCQSPDTQRKEISLGYWRLSPSSAEQGSMKVDKRDGGIRRAAAENLYGVASASHWGAA